jgi:hypothetical protein
MGERKKIAGKSIIGLEFITDNPPEKPQEVLEVLEIDRLCAYRRSVYGWLDCRRLLIRAAGR